MDVAKLIERLRTLNPWAEVGWPEVIKAAATALETLQRERDEAVEQELLAAQALESMQQNRDTLQRHFNECTIRAETAERERDEAREAARHILPYLRWTIGDESPGHHPTMPSAVAAFEGAFGFERAPLSPKEAEE